jgi:hypothetical protein
VESQLYPLAREQFATAQLSWLTGNWRALFLPESFVVDFDEHIYLSDLFEGSRIAISELIASRTATGGVCSGAPIKFPLLFDTRFITQAVIFKDTGVESTSLLVAYVGEEELVTDPFKPIGLNYFIYPNVAEAGFFRL